MKTSFALLFLVFTSLSSQAQVLHIYHCEGKKVEFNVKNIKRNPPPIQRMLVGELINKDTGHIELQVGLQQLMVPAVIGPKFAKAAYRAQGRSGSVELTVLQGMRQGGYISTLEVTQLNKTKKHSLVCYQTR